MKKAPAALWGILAVGVLAVHFWPMAYWSHGTLLFLRGMAGFCAQMWFLKRFPGNAAAALPLAATGLLAGWGVWMSLSSPAWGTGFPWDYSIALIACLAAWAVWRFANVK